jgi:DNA-directed RNA polymerase specialized sigma24 family protein
MHHHPGHPASRRPSSSTVTLDGGHDAHAALVLAAAAGNQIAWSALVQRFAGLVWAIARAYGLPAAQAASVAQATWLRLAQDLNRIPDPAHVGSWLAATARQESLRVLRLGGHHDLDTDLSLDLDLDVDVDGTPGDHLESDAALWQAFERLPAGCRRLLRVAAADPPPSPAEMSAALAIPITDIAATRRRCLDGLRQQQREPTALTAHGGHRE